MSRSFYHSTIVDQSWEILKQLKSEFDFVLIGGWAVWVYTKALKSKDIDFIISYSELEKLSQKYDLQKNENLLKYEIKRDSIDVDIYVPYYSKIGLPAEFIMNEVVQREGFTVPTIEVLFILKLYTYSKRKGTAKGEKDKIDTFSLLQSNIGWEKFESIRLKFDLSRLINELKDLIKETREIPELELNQFELSRLKKTLPKELR